MKKKEPASLFALLLLVLLAGCNKTTTRSGVVRNSADNQPLAGVQVSLTASAHDRGEFVVKDSDSDLTEEDGRYFVEICSPANFPVFTLATKDSFVERRIIGLDRGSCEEVDFFMHPIDSWLKLTLKNEHCFSGKIALDYTSPLYHDVVTSFGIHKIPLDSSKVFIEHVPGGDFIYFTWDTVSLYQKTEAIFITRGDTTEYTIKF